MINIDLEEFKRMCRAVEIHRHNFFESAARRYAGIVPRRQFIHLMLVRLELPCNLARIMAVTDLTSPGASLFVDKLVQKGILCRQEDARDRRNIIISATESGQALLQDVDDGLNRYILSYFSTCSDGELTSIATATKVVNSKLYQ